MYDDEALLAGFMQPKKRERYREMFNTPRLRKQFLNELAHFADFDPKFRLPLQSERLDIPIIARELQKRQSRNVVLAISENPALDGQKLPLLEALQETVGRGMGTVLSCIPGRLAFVETEDERFILERHDPLQRRSYIRFVVGRKDEDSNVKQGIFQAAALALEWGTITGSDADELNALRLWFSNNLDKPNSFGRDRLRLGICWFKEQAKEHISRIWEMVRILERNGIYVKKITTEKPGYIVFEDDWQLVAEPFRKGTLGRK